MSKPTDPIHQVNNEKQSQITSDHIKDTTSSEAAGIVRGSLRTIKRFKFFQSSRSASRSSTTSSKPMASELPDIPNYKTSSIWKIFALPRTLTKKGTIPNKHPAVKAGEHLVHDVTSMVLGQEGKAKESENKDSFRNHEHRRQQTLASWKHLASKAYSISTSLLKNTVTGIAVFETYEHVVARGHIEKSTSDSMFHATTTTTTMTTKQEAHGLSNTTSLFHHDGSSSLIQHFYAGLAAGSVHSILHLSFDSIRFFKGNGFHWNAYPSMSCLLSYGARDIIHHGTSHALMFSSYEGMKRLLSSNIKTNDKFNVEQKHDTLSFLNILLIGVAGGVAGQVHHVASHVTESLLFFKANEQRQQQQGKSTRILAKVIPCSRSTVVSFLPSALGFIAFEFGRSLVE